MPYRIDLPAASIASFERLIALGALDVDDAGGRLAAIMPDSVSPAAVAEALGMPSVAISRAIGRDDGSVWMLRPRETRVGGLTIAPADGAVQRDVLRLHDSAAFGTGLHPTTALCLEAIEWIAGSAVPPRALDVGTGSGVLALAALALGTEWVVGLDVEIDAIHAAAANRRLNDCQSRLSLIRGGPEAVRGSWPLVVANILAAPLMEMAPLVAPRVSSRGHLILSGISAGLAPEVEKSYVHCDMRPLRTEIRGGWAALIMTPSW